VTSPRVDDAGSTWARIDLEPYLASECEPLQPAFLRRSDGASLIYPSKVTLLSGAPEAGKGWIALRAQAEILDAGGSVAYSIWRTIQPASRRG
jgi:photosystem II stability/assembly factor-like uncharacterized protein